MGAVVWAAAIATSGIAAGLLGPAAVRAARFGKARLEVRARLNSADARDGRHGDEGGHAGIVPLVRVALRGMPGSDAALVQKLAASRVAGASCRAACRELTRLGVPHQPGAVWGCMAATGTLLGLTVGVASGSWIVGLVVALGAPWLVVLWLGRRADARAMTLAEQVPDALRTIDAALTAGLGVGKAIVYAARSTSGPLGLELRQVVWEVRAGRSLEGALERLRSRVGVAELELVVVALEVQHRSGGSLHAILESAIEVASQSHELERSLQVKTAQARLSARVVGVMPIVLVVALSLVSPGYLTGLAQQPAGVAMLVVAALLDVCGLLAIRSIMHVEV